MAVAASNGQALTYPRGTALCAAMFPIDTLGPECRSAGGGIPKKFRNRAPAEITTLINEKLQEVVPLWFGMQMGELDGMLKCHGTPSGQSRHVASTSCTVQLPCSVVVEPFNVSPPIISAFVRG